MKVKRLEWSWSLYLVISMVDLLHKGEEPAYEQRNRKKEAGRLT